MRHLLYIALIGVLASCASTSKTINIPVSIDGFNHWITGHDAATNQLLPAEGNNALTSEGGKTTAHVKFAVNQYGEVSFPINTKTPAGAEALQVNLSAGKQIQITYQANQQFILQLRQTGVHGGVHNQVTLPAVNQLTSVTVLFSEFKGGKTPLDLTNVAKFNFAFLSHNPKEGFAELIVHSFIIDKYKP